MASYDHRDKGKGSNMMESPQEYVRSGDVGSKTGNEIDQTRHPPCTRNRPTQAYTEGTFFPEAARDAVVHRRDIPPPRDGPPS